MTLRLGCARDSEGIWLVEQALPEAHDALGWTLPIDDEEGRELLRWSARGDVIRDEVVVVESTTQKGEHVPYNELAGKLLAPWVSAIVHDQITELPVWSVTPHIRMLPFRTPTLPPATHTNSFLIGDGPMLLVEPAPVDPAELKLLEEWARSADVMAVFATHHHVDHVGGVALAQRLGVPLWAHAQTASRMRAPVGRLVEDGEVLSLGGVRLEAIHTPGHAPGHLCLYERTSQTLIAGDMVAGTGTILVEPSEGDMSLYLASLERLRDLGARFALPAHGGVIANPSAYFQHYIDHRLQREQRVVDALRAEGQTLEELLPQVYGDVPKAVWPFASLSLRAHLDKLIADQRAQLVDTKFSTRA